MTGALLNVITAIGSIGTFIGVVITAYKMIKASAEVQFKTEKLYGTEATERYEAILRTTPEKSDNAFGPDEYRGGNKATPQFEVERFYFDSQTMPPQWKGLTRTVRYYYMDNGKTMIRGWRF